MPSIEEILGVVIVSFFLSLILTWLIYNYNFNPLDINITLPDFQVVNISSVVMSVIRPTWIITPHQGELEETGPKENTFEYLLRGSVGYINFTVYKGVNDYFAGLPREYQYYGIPPSDRDLELIFINDEKQRKYIKQLAEIIKSKTNNSDDQVRIAVSLVQLIPYDWEGYSNGSIKIDTPTKFSMKIKGFVEKNLDF